MKKIKIVTDSSCDLNKDIIEKYDIKVVPLNVSFGEDVYIDGQLDNKEFYDRMSKTSMTLVMRNSMKEAHLKSCRPS